MNRRYRRARRLSILTAVALALTSTDALGHGAAPAPLDIIASDAQGPIFVRTNIGFAGRWPGRVGDFRFFCPSMFDALGAVPLVGRFRSGDLIVPRFEGVTAGTMGGCAFAPLDVPEWQARTVIAVAGDGPVFVVTRDERGSAVFVFDDAMSAPRIERFDDVKLDDVMVLDDGWPSAARDPSPRSSSATTRAGNRPVILTTQAGNRSPSRSRLSSSRSGLRGVRDSYLRPA